MSLYNYFLKKHHKLFCSFCNKKYDSTDYIQCTTSFI